MSSYARFFNSDKISKQFWACRPRNPLCGLVSLEKGTKFWLWTSLFACSIYGIRLAYLLFEAQRLTLSPAELQDLKERIKGARTYSIVLPTHPILEWFSKFIICCVFGFYTWRLIEVILARDVPKLKSRFMIMCLINFVWFPMLYFEIMAWINDLDLPHILNLPAILITMLFEVIGLLYTYSYISTMINPPQEESRNIDSV